MTEFQSVIQVKVDRLCTILQEEYATTKITNASEGSSSDNVVSMDRAFVALTTDIITEYAFAKSYDHLESPRFRQTLHEALMAIYTSAHLAKPFPFLFAALNALPEWLVRQVMPAISPVISFRNDLRRQIGKIRKFGVHTTRLECSHDRQRGQQTAAHQKKEKRVRKNNQHLTIFHELLGNPELPPAEKTDERLGDEAVLVIAAGLVTTSWALAVATFHLARNPAIVAAMRRELLQAGYGIGRLAQHPSYDWNTLQRLPYLHGIVYEAIRLSHGTTNRHPRLASETDLVYGPWRIPRNTPVSMTTVDVMMNERLFPEPKKFIPERWVRGGAELERYFVPFGKGSRQCLGIR